MAWAQLQPASTLLRLQVYLFQGLLLPPGNRARETRCADRKDNQSPGRHTY